jgi:hypothetical protein
MWPLMPIIASDDVTMFVPSGSSEYGIMLVVCVVNSNHYPGNNVSTIERFSDACCSPDCPDF